MNDHPVTVDAQHDPLGIGPITGVLIARAWINQPQDNAYDLEIWNRTGHSPASIWFHYGQAAFLPEWSRYRDMRLN